MRLIDADALIAEYDRVHIGKPGGARKLMVDAPTIEERKWIPCSERLPELGKPVLATSVGRYQNFVGVDWVDSWTEKWAQSVEVTAWMPLPEPYEEGAK